MLVTKATKLGIVEEFRAIGLRSGATFGDDSIANRMGRLNWTVQTLYGPLSVSLCDGLEVGPFGRVDPYALPWIICRFRDLQALSRNVNAIPRPVSLTTGKWNWHEVSSVSELALFEEAIGRLRGVSIGETDG